MPTRPRHSVLLATLIALLASLLLSSGQSASAATAAQQIRVVTFNVDFAIKDAATVRNQLNAHVLPYADVVFLQEAKNFDFRTIVDTSVWVVRQGDPAGWAVSSEDEKGSAILVRRSIAIDTADYGLVKGVDASSCPNGGIMTRWIAKMKVQLSNGRWVRIGSLHMPPDRCRIDGVYDPYDRMADNVVEFVNRTPMFTVLGADWNAIVDNDPNNIGGRSGLEANGPDAGAPLRIDGFMYSPTLTNCCMTVLPKTYGDHYPVQLKLTVPGLA